MDCNLHVANLKWINGNCMAPGNERISLSVRIALGWAVFNTLASHFLAATCEEEEVHGVAFHQIAFACHDTATRR